MDRRDLLRAAAAVGAAGSLLPQAAEANPTAPALPRLTLRKAEDRGHANHGWLDTWHSFSFASYMDPRHMGFRGLRVINEDWIAAGRGFPMHPHDNMEIVTYVLEGSLEHKDSLGSGGVIVPGNVQRMSAGTGIRHSEFNPSRTERTHLLQIWMLPSQRGIKPSYEDKTFPVAERQGALRVVASPDARRGSVKIHADNVIYASTLRPNDVVKHEVARGRHLWLQVARGTLAINGQALKAGDGVSTSDAGHVTLTGGAGGAEVLLFDLA
jgi:redox-sensitive bicupin YhaK (pirin superfamily)